MILIYIPVIHIDQLKWYNWLNFGHTEIFVMTLVYIYIFTLTLEYIYRYIIHIVPWPYLNIHIDP